MQTRPGFSLNYKNPRLLAQCNIFGLFRGRKFLFFLSTVQIDWCCFSVSNTVLHMCRCLTDNSQCTGDAHITDCAEISLERGVSLKLCGFSQCNTCIMMLFSVSAIQCYTCVDASDNSQCTGDAHITDCTEISSATNNYDACKTKLEYKGNIQIYFL